MDQRGIDSGAYYTHMKTKEGRLLWTKNASDGTILSGGLNKNYHKEMLGGRTNQKVKKNTRTS